MKCFTQFNGYERPDNARIICNVLKDFKTHSIFVKVAWMFTYTKLKHFDICTQTWVLFSIVCNHLYKCSKCWKVESEFYKRAIQIKARWCYVQNTHFKLSSSFETPFTDFANLPKSTCKCCFIFFFEFTKLFLPKYQVLNLLDNLINNWLLETTVRIEIQYKKKTNFITLIFYWKRDKA